MIKSGCGLDQRRLGIFENGECLGATDAGKPFQELLHGRAAFEVLEQRPHWYACSLEHPRAADLARHLFNHRALIPIQHAGNIPALTDTGKLEAHSPVYSGAT